MRLILTGFGPFGTIGDNPSSALVRSSGLPHELLEVSYRGVEEWLESLDPNQFDGLLLLGVAAGRAKMCVETTARNWIGQTPDVRGESWGPLPIDPNAPSQLAATLWPGEALMETEDRVASVDAGDYLCNFLLFRSLQRFASKRIGFLHVPTFEAMPQTRQEQALTELLQVLGHPSV